MAINRTAYNAIVDSNGTPGHGTPWDKALIATSLLDPIDAEIATVVGAGLTAGSNYINDTANADITVGLTINMGAADNQILALKSSDVAHGVTTIAETDTFAVFKKAVSGDGGLKLQGLTDDVEGFYMEAIVTNVSTVHTAGADAAIVFNAALKAGTGLQTMTANANLMAILDNAGARFIIDTEGDTFQDGTAGTYAEWDDPMLALAVEHHMSPKAHVRELFAQYCQYNKQTLIDAGILAPDGPNGERGFVNMSALIRLAIGGVWQLAMANKTLEARLENVERQLARLLPEGDHG